MTRWIAGFTTNQRLAAIAVLLGVGALFSTTTARASLDPRELAVAIASGTNRVQPRDLADRILEGRSDYRLIDLRDTAAFAAYHIPGAENLPLTSLADPGIGHTETVLLYSEDGSRAAEAWVLLRAQRYQAVYVLDRGLDGWKQDVLFPALKESPANQAERQANERLRQVSIHFGGAPRMGGEQGAASATPAMTVAMPKIEAPVLPAGERKPAAKKKKEGC
jgi:rhodanese-related sulfurtransferase